LPIAPRLSLTLQSRLRNGEAELLRTLADVEIAHDVSDVLEETRPDVLVVDCMIPAAVVAAQAASTPVVSLVHF
jgi:hypothetical protein